MKKPTNSGRLQVATGGLSMTEVKEQHPDAKTAARDDPSTPPRPWRGGTRGRQERTRRGDREGPARSTHCREGALGRGPGSAVAWGSRLRRPAGEQGPRRSRRPLTAAAGEVEHHDLVGSEATPGRTAAPNLRGSRYPEHRARRFPGTSPRISGGRGSSHNAVPSTPSLILASWPEGGLRLGVWGKGWSWASWWLENRAGEIRLLKKTMPLADFIFTTWAILSWGLSICCFYSFLSLLHGLLEKRDL